MSIVILQGPRSATPRPAIRDLSRLWRKARAAGHVLDFRMSESVEAFIGSIRCATSGNCAFVLLDPGALQEHHLRETCDALETLPMPYIEVHYRSADVLDRPLSPVSAPVATIVINGDLAASYSIALGIALRRIGRDRAGGRAAPTVSGYASPSA